MNKVCPNGLNGCKGCDPELRSLAEICSVCGRNIISASSAALATLLEIQRGIEESFKKHNKSVRKYNKSVKERNNLNADRLISEMLDKSSTFAEISDKASLKDFIKQWTRLFEEYINVNRYPFLKEPYIEEFFNGAFSVQKCIIEFVLRAIDLDWENTSEKKVFYTDLSNQNDDVVKVILLFWPYPDEEEAPPPPPPRNRTRGQKVFVTNSNEEKALSEEEEAPPPPPRRRNRPQPPIPSVEGNKAPPVPDRSLKPKLQRTERFCLSNYSPPKDWTCGWRSSIKNIDELAKKVPELAKK